MTHRAGGPVRVVLADDAVELRRLLRITLEHDERVCVVAEAGDGREAVDVVTATGAGCLVLDLVMPVMDGFQVIAELQAVAPDTSVVVLSGFPASEMGKRSLEAGAVAYLEKGDAILTLADTIVSVSNPRGGVAPV